MAVLITECHEALTLEETEELETVAAHGVAKRVVRQRFEVLRGDRPRDVLVRADAGGKSQEP